MLSVRCFWLPVAIALVLGLVSPRVIATGQNGYPPYAGAYPYSVAVTVGMVADLVTNVGGEKVRVKTLIGSGVDPHSYTPSRADVALLLRADVVFSCGLLLEGRMTDVLNKVGQQKPVIAVAERLDPEYIRRESHQHADPHVWMDVRGWIMAVQVVTEALSAFDPANAPLYAANAQHYTEQLTALDQYVRRVLATIPQEQRIMVTAHDAFGYMGRAYGLEVVGIQGLSTESEAGLQDVNRIVDLLVERKVPAVFVETSVSDKNVRALVEGARARGHTVVIGGALFSDAMGEPGTYEGTYIGMIDHNATTIARALQGDAPTGGMLGKLRRP